MESHQKLHLQSALENPTAGPRPLTIEEYRRRLAKNPSREPQPIQRVKEKKIRTGVEAKFRERLLDAQRELVLAGNKEARKLANHKIAKIKAQRQSYRREKRAARIKSKTNN